MQDLLALFGDAGRLGRLGRALVEDFRDDGSVDEQWARGESGKTAHFGGRDDIERLADR